MSTHWYFGNQENNSGVSVQSLGNRTIITLPNEMTIVTTGGTVSFTSHGRGRGFPATPIGPRGPAHANDNRNNQEENRGGRGGRGRGNNRGRRRWRLWPEQRRRRANQRAQNANANANAEAARDETGDATANANAAGPANGSTNTNADGNTNTNSNRALQPTTTNIPAPTPAPATQAPGPTFISEMRNAFAHLDASQLSRAGPPNPDSSAALYPPAASQYPHGEEGIHANENQDQEEWQMPSVNEIEFDGLNGMPAATPICDIFDTSGDLMDLAEEGDFSREFTDGASTGTL